MEFVDKLNLTPGIFYCLPVNDVRIMEIRLKSGLVLLLLLLA